MNAARYDLEQRLCDMNSGLPLHSPVLVLRSSVRPWDSGVIIHDVSLKRRVDVNVKWFCDWPVPCKRCSFEAGVGATCIFDVMHCLACCLAMPYSVPFSSRVLLPLGSTPSPALSSSDISPGALELPLLPLPSSISRRNQPGLTFSFR